LELGVLVLVEEEKQENPEKRRWVASSLMGSPFLPRLVNLKTEK